MQRADRRHGRRGVDEGTREHALRRACGSHETLGTGMGGMDDRAACKRLRQDIRRRIAAVKPRQRPGMTLADEQGVRQDGLERTGLFDPRHRQYAFSPRRERMGHERAGAEHIDDHSDAGRRRSAGEQRDASDAQPAQARTAAQSMPCKRTSMARL